MADDDIPLLIPEPHFHRAKGLNSRGAFITFDKGDNSTSYAQVETSVEQKSVQRKSGGLKPDKSRPFHIGIRLTPRERAIVVQHAEKWGLTISEYVRKASVEPLQPTSRDPERNRHLENICRELKRQGNNLNQITRQFNAHQVTPVTAESLVQIIARPLMQAYQAVRHALTDGQSAP